MLIIVVVVWIFVLKLAIIAITAATNVIKKSVTCLHQITPVIQFVLYFTIIRARLDINRLYPIEFIVSSRQDFSHDNYDHVNVRRSNDD